ncbi:hypothetical protein MMC09_001907 [Bachmanniomyces sp. S44760]|nr:hypothetical protein [Bachmanniomyces sp. S44760]
MSDPFVALIPPLGPSVLHHFHPQSNPTAATSQHLPTDPSIPPTLDEALSVRRAVFVEEQGVPLENEIDADDPRSWQWVVYASIGPAKGGEQGSTQTGRVGEGEGRDGNGRKGSEGSKVAVGVIRVVPPPHGPHPTPGSGHEVDNADGLVKSSDGELNIGADTAIPANLVLVDRATSFHDGVEPYVKLGRLATLKEYRGLGLGRLLVNNALEWLGKHGKENVQPRPNDPVERERTEGGAGAAAEWKGLVLAHANVAAEGFWKSMGFEKDEGMGEWWEEGIRHVGMFRRLEV